MSEMNKIYIVGEVLYDCFPDGQSVLGGAPFNLAWHLYALGDNPHFISRVGRDEYGTQVLEAMKQWGMDISGIQVDEEYPTGQVEVIIKDNEPSYNIVNNSAYDFISAEELPEKVMDGILYHGSLSLRNEPSRKAYEKLIKNKGLQVFFDVNLRSPWWKREELYRMLESAHWVKMNMDELQLLASRSADVKDLMSEVQSKYEIEQLIVTQGEEGALVRTAAGELYHQIPDKVARFVDTVGAGDAFSSMYIHGLQKRLSVDSNLQQAQKFAGKVVGLRGGTTSDLEFYQEFITP
ncbi:carbohydrate kinase family protein [Desulforhopalus sp. 52FAK]